MARIASTGASGAGFLRSRSERLAELFTSAAGHPVRVEIVEEQRADEPAAPPKRPATEIDPKHLEHPVVRDALELFNAVVTRVEPNPESASEEASTRSA